MINEWSLDEGMEMQRLIACVIAPLVCKKKATIEEHNIEIKMGCL